MEVVLQRMQALEEDDEDRRSPPREPRGYRERMARDHRTRGEATISPILVMKKRKEADEVGERQERVAP
jgi:hypothetical protein